jgi:hypothetical protein
LPIWSRTARQRIWNGASISSGLPGWRSLLTSAAIAEALADETSDQKRYRSCAARGRAVHRPRAGVCFHRLAGIPFHRLGWK